MVVGFTLLAFALRVHRLGHQSLWDDEILALMGAKEPLGEMIQSLTTIRAHPPLYYITLRLWIFLLGQSEFTTRFLSVVLGLLIIPLVYRLGSMLYDEKVGCLAALIGAFSPYLISHAQDVRMYSLFVSLGLGSILLFNLALEKNSRHLWYGYLALTLGALYTHYFSVFIVIIESLLFLHSLLAKPSQERQRLGHWFVIQLTIAVLYVPWVIYVAEFMLGHTKLWIAPVGLLTLLKRLLVVYSVGKTVPGVYDSSKVYSYFVVSTTAPGNCAVLLVLVFLATFLLGCYCAIRLPGEKAVTLGTYLFLPIAGIWLVSLFRPVFDERFLLFIVPAYWIFLALGLNALFQQSIKLAQGSIGRLVSLGVGGLLLTLMLTASSYSLFNYFYIPDYAKGHDWRTFVATLRQQSGPGDLIIQNYPDPDLGYYLQGDLPLVILPASSPVDPVATADALAKLAREHQRLWLLPQRFEFWDADGFVERWLNRHCDKISQQEVASLPLNLYLTPSTFLGQMTPVKANLGDRAELLGYRLVTDTSNLQSGVLTTRPNNALRLTLYWRALSPMEISYTVFTHLLDAKGQLWAQKDNLPVRGSYPTIDWTTDEVIVDKYDIVIPPDAPPGEYVLEVGLYDVMTGQRLPVLDERGAGTDNRVLLSDQIMVSRGD